MKKIIIKKPGNYIFKLNKKGQELEVLALLQAKDLDELTLKVLIVHEAPHTSANVVLKATAEDSSKVNIFGKIKIEKNCHNINSYLTEKILLLSANATAVAVPDLEILSDDVKCSHSASVSKIPESQLFYLKSRGLSEKKAKELIVTGFLEN